MEKEQEFVGEVALELNEFALAYVVEARDEIAQKLPSLGADICDILARGLIPKDEHDKWTEHVANLIRFHAVIAEAFDTLMQVQRQVIQAISEHAHDMEDE